MRKSLASILISVSVGSGNTATVTVEVVDGPNAGVDDILFTCTNSSPFSLPTPISGDPGGTWLDPVLVLFDPPVFDPATDGIDFYESLEGMLVQVNEAVAVGPTNGFGEIAVLADDGAGAGVRSARGGIVVRPGDFNPERIILDDVLNPTPSVNTGDHFTTDIVGVFDYSFGNFKLLVTSELAGVDEGLEREIATATTARELSIATFNAKDLHGSSSQFRQERHTSTREKGKNTVGRDDLEVRHGRPGGVICGGPTVR